MKQFALSCLTALALAAPLLASAGDRPFLATTSAAAEEDDDNVWSLQTWFARTRFENSLHSAAEYNFNPNTSAQIEWSRSRAKGAAGTQDLEFEVKHLFNNIARDGWGWGVNATAGFEREDGKWRYDGWTLTLPFSVKAGESALVHVNAGVIKPRDARRVWTSSVGTEIDLPKRLTFFAELARDGDGTLAHAGVRHWIKKEKLSFDVGFTQRRVDGTRVNGWVIGLGFSDL